MTAETTESLEPTGHPVSSFAKALFRGEVHSEMVTPFPVMAPEEHARVSALVGSAKTFLAESYDPRVVEEQGWIGDDVVAGLGERGLLGLYVDPEYGGQGLTQTGYCRVSEEFGVDPTLSVVMGVHQSIGMKPIHLFGTDDQKARWLPDLASGRKLAGFALTEPNAGSDAYHLETRAERQADGSWVLNGEKQWIGNGDRDVVVCFARSDHGHVALVLEKGMEGFEPFERHATMGLSGNHLMRLRFRDVKVPKENLLGEAGDGFTIAMHTLNNGRMSLGTGAVGSVKKLLAQAVEYTSERRQFGRPLNEFGLVEQKLSWMTTQLYGLESLAYLTTGLVDTGVEDYSVESAMAKVASTEFLWYAANRVFQVVGGRAYMKENPYEKVLRDIRIFPIFEGSNDVMRTFIALSGAKSVGEELSDLGDLGLSDPIASIGTIADYVVKRVRRGVRPAGFTGVHASLRDLADPLGEQVATLRGRTEELVRRYGRDITEHQLPLKRLSEASTDVYAQMATLSRLSALVEDQGVGPSGTERHLAETFCGRAAKRVSTQLGRIERHDDETTHSIGRLTINSGGYPAKMFGLA